MCVGHLLMARMCTKLVVDGTAVVVNDKVSSREKCRANARGASEG